MKQRSRWRGEVMSRQDREVLQVPLLFCFKSNLEMRSSDRVVFPKSSHAEGVTSPKIEEAKASRRGSSLARAAVVNRQKMENGSAVDSESAIVSRSSQKTAYFPFKKGLFESFPSVDFPSGNVQKSRFSPFIKRLSDNVIAVGSESSKALRSGQKSLPILFVQFPAPWDSWVKIEKSSFWWTHYQAARIFFKDKFEKKII